MSLAPEEFEIDRRPKKVIPIHPLLDFLELLNRHRAGEKEVFRAQITPLDYVFLRGVIIVSRSDSVAIDPEIGKIIEHLLDLLHIGFLVNRRVGRDLVAEQLRHFDREDALLENAFALDDEIVRPLETIEVHVPIHPTCRSDWTIADWRLRIADR